MPASVGSWTCPNTPTRTATTAPAVKAVSGIDMLFCAVVCAIGPGCPGPGRLGIAARATGRLPSSAVLRDRAGDADVPARVGAASGPAAADPVIASTRGTPAASPRAPSRRRPWRRRRLGPRRGRQRRRPTRPLPSRGPHPPTWSGTTMASSASIASGHSRAGDGVRPGPPATRKTAAVADGHDHRGHSDDGHSSVENPSRMSARAARTTRARRDGPSCGRARSRRPSRLHRRRRSPRPTPSPGAPGSPGRATPARPAP